MSIEAQLRDTLQRGADDLGQLDPPSAVSAQGLAFLDERRRRRQTGVLAAGLAAVLVGVAVPVGLSLVGSDGNDTRIAAPPAIPGAASSDIFGGQTRGSLADDTAFIEAVRQLNWSDELPGFLPDPGLDTKNVVFAGEVAGQRWALVVAPSTMPGVDESTSGENATDVPAVAPSVVPAPAPRAEDGQPVAVLSSLLDTAWYVGPLGAAAQQMTMPQFQQGLSADVPASIIDSASGALIVVAAPGDVIETSARPEVAADGTVSRSFVDTNSTDGTAAVALEVSPYQNGEPSVQYRVSREGQVLVEQGPNSGIVFQAPSPEISLEYLRPPVSDFPEVQTINSREQQMAAGVLTSYGLSPADVQFRVPYIGPLALADRQQAELTVVTATFPSGAVLTRASWDLIDLGTGEGYGGSCGTDRPSGAWAAADQLVLGIRCDVSVPTSETEQSLSTTLVVLAPPALGAVIAMTQGGEVDPVTLDLSDGVGMVTFPEGAQTVVIADASGATIQEVPINQM